VEEETHAFHTVPKDPVPSFSSNVYAADGSAKVDVLIVARSRGRYSYVCMIECK
jgi:hypothetical protein